MDYSAFSDKHQGRPVDPIYAERAAALQAQWDLEDQPEPHGERDAA